MQPPCDVKALYEYRSEHADDLNFDVGQVIHVTAIEDEEWLSGSYHDPMGSKQSGIFPKNFVELIEAPKAPARPTRTTTHQAAAPSHSSNTKELAVSTIGGTNEPLIASSQAESNAPSTTEQKPQLHRDIDESRSAVPQAKNLDQDAKPLEAQPLETKTMTTTEGHTPQLGSDFSPPETTMSSLQDQSKASATSTPVRDTQALNTGSATNLAASAQSSEAKSSLKEISNQDIHTKTSADQEVPATAKPAKSNAFRDRIAAFNKQGAAPVAPKPMAKPNLAKKPFVAPPPSKDAYQAAPAPVKPRASTTVERTSEVTSEAASVPVNRENEESVKQEQPVVVGSLKERIAALQAEQRQAAAKRAAMEKHAEVNADEENQGELHDVTEETELREDTLGKEDVQKELAESKPTIRSMPVVPSTSVAAESAMPQSPQLSRQDTNRSIESIRPQNTGASIQSSRSIPAVTRMDSMPVVPQALREEKISEDPVHVSQKTESAPAFEAAETDAAETDANEEVEEEDEMDEEERRKQALRARMAKMSGGMGMHMALGFGGPTPASRAPKHKPATEQQKSPEMHANEATDSQAMRVPMPGLSMLPTPSSTMPRDEPAMGTLQLDVESDDQKSSSSPLKSTTTSFEGAPRDATDLPASVAALSLSPSIPTQPPRQSAEADVAPRAIPPPIPGGRPSTLMPVPYQDHPVVHPQPESTPTPTPTPTPSRPVGSNEHDALQTLQPRASVDSTRGPPPPIPHAARASIDSMRSPPPIPSTAGISRSPLASPDEIPQSPVLSPESSKRMSYFGAPSSSSVYRPSMESNSRRSIEQSRSSFDALSRTNSHGIQAPSRPPPPPSVPAARAPPPPVPVSSPPTKHAPTPPSLAAASASDTMSGAPVYPRSYETQTIQHDTIPSENEREGYEADDDDTDITSDGTQLAIDPTRDTEQPALQSTDKAASSSAKKKGIKGLFKRKDKS